MKTTRKALSLVMVLALALSLLAGCGQSSTEEGTVAAASSTAASAGETVAAATTNLDPANPVTITMWNSAEGNWANVLQALVDEFNSTVGAEKGIIVENTYAGSDVTAKLKELAQADDWDNFPDTAQIYSAGIPTVATWDNLLSMDTMYSKGYEVTVAKSDILAPMVRTYEYEGEFLAMPLNASALLMYYNKTAAVEAGLNVDNPPATIEELADWTDKLTIRNSDGTIARYGMNIQIDRYELVNFLSGISDTGCNYFGDNGGGRDGLMTKLTIGEDGSLEKFLGEWDKVIATGGYKAVNDDERGEFGTQLSAINFQSCAQLATMMGKAEAGGFELGVAAIPACTAEDNFGVCVGGGAITMFDKGDDAKIEASWIFLQYMASADSQLYISGNTGYLPVVAAAYEGDGWAEVVEKLPGLAVAKESLDKADPGMQEPFEILNTDLNKLVQTSMIAYANGEMDKTEVISSICDTFNERLAEYIDANY